MTTPTTLRMRTYSVTVEGFPSVVYSARSPAKARSKAWQHYSSAFDCSFKNFLRISRVRSCGVPADDGYAYVRRTYGVDPKVGDRVRLVNEGQASGQEGEVVYPGQSTAHVHVLLDGREHVSIVHPMSIEFVTPTTISAFLETEGVGG